MSREEVIETGEYVKKCPACGSDKLILDYTRGELICAVCGLVITDRSIDRGPEWRAFTPEERERRSRVGAPMSRVTPDSLVTVIDWRARDASGRDTTP